MADQSTTHGAARATACEPPAPGDGDMKARAADLAQRANQAAGLLKAIAHEGRLMILCHLSDRERSVTELEELLDIRQAAVSQQLARLRMENLVAARREGKAIYYSIADPRAARVVALMYDLYCAPEARRTA